MKDVESIAGNKMCAEGYHVGKQIRDIRKKQKRTMAEVANKLGIHYQQLQRIELTGKSTVESLIKIATELQHGLIIYPSKIDF